MSAAFRKRIEAARARQDKAMWAVFEAGAPGRNDVRFSECFAAAPEATRAAFDEARSRVDALEAEAVAKGKAWRSSGSSLLHWYC